MSFSVSTSGEDSEGEGLSTRWSFILLRRRRRRRKRRRERRKRRRRKRRRREEEQDCYHLVFKVHKQILF